MGVYLAGVYAGFERSSGLFHQLPINYPNRLFRIDLSEKNQIPSDLAAEKRASHQLPFGPAQNGT